MRIVFLIFILFFSIGAFAQEPPPPDIPRKYDIKQDDRFNNYITADNELARTVEVKVAGVEMQLKIITAILTAIGLALVGSIVSRIISRTWGDKKE